MRTSHTRHTGLKFALAIAATLQLTACATTSDPPYAALQSAQTAIKQAEQARVEPEASGEMVEAQQKLAAANEAVQHEDMDRAAVLAQESRVAAELALAKSEAAKADRVNAEIEASTDELEDQFEGNDGEPQ